MPRCRVTRRVHFNAAHRLHNPDATEAWNQATYGVCNNPNFHGHNYELDLSVEGEIDPGTGYVMDLNHLKDLAQERLLRHLDHKNLNLDVPWFRDLVPTSENIALVCWRELRAALPDRARASSPPLGNPEELCRLRRRLRAGPSRRPGGPERDPRRRAEPHLEPFADKVRDDPRRPGRGSRRARVWSRRRSGSSRRCGSSPRATTCRWRRSSATRCSRRRTRA